MNGIHFQLWFGLLLFFLGTAIGSFINVVVDRLPKGKKITGRSKCDYCKKTLAPLDLIPIFSFVFIRGRCRYCHKKLSWQYPVVELLTGILFVVIYYLLLITNINLLVYQLLTTIYYLLLLSILWSIFLMDLKYMIIADELQIVLGITSIPLFLRDPFGHSIGAIVLSGLFYGIYRMTKRKGMGFGDVKLAFIMGFMLGWYHGLIAVYISFITGGLIGMILLIMRRKGMKSKVAFGPFLVISSAIMLLFPDQITRLISSLFGI